MVDGGLNSVCVTCDEDFMIAIVYIADLNQFITAESTQNYKDKKNRELLYFV